MSFQDDAKRSNHDIGSTTNAVVHSSNLLEQRCLRADRLVIDSRRANANTDGSIISCGE